MVRVLVSRRNIVTEETLLSEELFSVMPREGDSVIIAGYAYDVTRVCWRESPSGVYSPTIHAVCKEP